MTLGNGNDETAAPFPNKLQLLHDFVFQVPGKNDDVIGLGFANAVRMINRNVTAGRKRPCL